MDGRSEMFQSERQTFSLQRYILGAAPPDESKRSIPINFVFVEYQFSSQSFFVFFNLSQGAAILSWQRPLLSTENDITAPAGLSSPAHVTWPKPEKQLRRQRSRCIKRFLPAPMAGLTSYSDMTLMLSFGTKQQIGHNMHK